MEHIDTNSKIKYIIYIGAAILLFLAIRCEFVQIHPSNPKPLFKHDNHWLAGSMLKARQDGLFSTGTFTTIHQKKGNSIYEAQYLTQELYESTQENVHIPADEWYVYPSALRWPYSIYITIDWLVWKATGEARNLLPLFETMASIFMVISLLILLSWVGRYFGYLVVIASAILFCFCQWFIYASNSPGPDIWLYIFPLAVGLFIFSGKYAFRPDKKTHLLLYGGISTMAIACIGYEFTPNTMVSFLLPPIFYVDFKKEAILPLIHQLFFIGIGALTGFAATLILHFLTIVYLEGSIIDAFEYFKFKYSYRTSGQVTSEDFGRVKDSVENFRAKKASFSSVFKSYLNGSRLLGPLNLKDILVLIGLSLPLFLLPKTYFPLSYTHRSKHIKLFIMVFGAFLGTVAFFVIFKAHAVIHKHIDYIVFSFAFLLLFIIYYTSIISTFLKDIFNWFLSKKLSYGILYGIAFLPLLLFFNKKYKWIHQGKMEFNQREVVCFDIFDEDADFRLNENNTSLDGNTITALTPDPQLYIRLDSTAQDDVYILLKFRSNKRGRAQIFYDYCIDDRFTNRKSIKRTVFYGDNTMYIHLKPDSCAHFLRLDLIDKKGGVLEIEEILVKD